MAKEVNPVDMETMVDPGVTPLDGVGANVEQLEKEIAERDAKISQLTADNEKLVKAFNMLLDEYNTLHVQTLLAKSGIK